MKNINKNAYQEAKYGRKHLMIFAIVSIILSLALLGSGIALIVVGATSGETAKIIWMVILGVIMAVLGVVFGVFSIIMFFTSTSMIKVDQGSVKDGNRAIGSVNVVKCDKCGEELPDNATFCSKCGTAVEGKKVCKCGTANSPEAEYCIGCGEKLN